MDNDEEDDDGCSYSESVHGDELTFGRISQDINALNAFFGQVFPMLTNVSGRGRKQGHYGDNYDAGRVVVVVVVAVLT